ncbi:hypothetical protein [Saccharothrix xinjiangensis]|uniref:DUF3307 domain-containing protein n=1 Tax=Saccharothrix xinjiangensis TaxID=204798 RepID=A0ABV9XW38_9PSEU
MLNPDTFLLTLAAVLPGHWLADHWFQTPTQVKHKGARTRFGQLVCANHAATHILVTAPFLAATFLSFESDVSLQGLVAGQLWTFLSHYAIDRRWTLHRAARFAGRLGFSGQVFHDLGAKRIHKVRAVRPGHADSSITVEELVDLDVETIGTGRYALDQAAHHSALFLTALITALVS